MRKIILIAAMALTSAAAQAGDTRNLSTAATPGAAPATIQTKQFQAQNDAPAATPAKPADAPRYSAPPSETQTPAAAPTAPSTATPSTAQPERRYDDRGYFDDAGYHPFPRRYTDADRDAGRPDRDAERPSAERPSADRDAERPRGRTSRPYHRAWWATPRRFMAEMRRYGFYW